MRLLCQNQARGGQLRGRHEAQGKQFRAGLGWAPPASCLGCFVLPAATLLPALLPASPLLLLGVPLAAAVVAVARCCLAGGPRSAAAPSQPPQQLPSRLLVLQVPFIVTAPQPQATEEAPFFSEPPAFWKPTEIQPPEAISVPTAPALPAELLKPGAVKRVV